MANYVLKNTVGKLVKDMQETAKFMSDMEVFFIKQWKNGAGINKEVSEYVDQKKLETLIGGYQKMSNVIEVLAGNVEQLLNMQAKQSIDIVKVGQKGKLTHKNIADPVIEEMLETSKDGIRLIDPSIYSRGSSIGWNTLGLVPRDIIFNEFDLARMSDITFDVFDQLHIRERWSSLIGLCKSLTGMKLSEVQKAYAVKRGLTYTAKKRGRGSKSSGVTTTQMEVK